MSKLCLSSKPMIRLNRWIIRSFPRSTRGSPSHPNFHGLSRGFHEINHQLGVPPCHDDGNPQKSACQVHPIQFCSRCVARAVNGASGGTVGIANAYIADAGDPKSRRLRGGEDASENRIEMDLVYLNISLGYNAVWIH